MTRLACAALVATLVLLGIERAEANGGTLRVARAPAGPYVLSVWTQPDPPRAGEIDVSVAVMSPATGEAVLDARAIVRAAAGATMSMPVRTLERGGGGNRLLYHALVDLPAASRWVMTISVSGELGSGETSFQIDVEHPVPVVWWFVAGGLVLVVIALALRWLVRRATHVKVVASTVVLALMATTADAAQPFDRARYRPQTIAALVREYPAGPGMVIVSDVPIRNEAVYSSVFRPFVSRQWTPPDPRADVMRIEAAARVFKQELRVDEAGTTYWLPVQQTLVPHIASELKTGDTIELFLVFVGYADGRTLLVVNAFSHDGPAQPTGR